MLLYRFFIAISRAVVNCDDSSSLAPHPLVWSAGSFPKRRRIIDIVRDVALVPGPLHLLGSDWISVPPVVVSAAGICLWPYSVDVLIKLVTFLSSLHWPSDGGDLGPGGISYVELLILYVGDLVGFLVLCCVRYVFCLVVWAGFFLEILVPITAGCVILVGFSLVMVSLPGLVRLLMFGSLMSCFFSLVTLLGRDVLCCVVLCL